MTRITDTRRFYLKRILAADYIPLFGGRPSRAEPIGQDDILDLRITLGCTETIDQLIAILYKDGSCRK